MHYIRIFYVVLSRVGRGLAMGRSIVEGVLMKCPEEFIISEVNFEAKQARRHNPWHLQSNINMGYSFI